MITIGKLKKQILALVKRFPDNVYKPYGKYHNCSYTKGKCTNGSKGCLFGQALIKLKVDPDKLKKLDREIRPIDNLLDQLGIKYTEKQRQWLMAVQDGQDKKLTWKDALRYKPKRKYIKI